MTLTRRDLLRAGALLGLGAVAGCATDQDTRSVNAAALGPSKHGGVLRVGITGGSAADGLDPHHPPTYPDQARVSNLYEPLFLHDVVVQHSARAGRVHRAFRPWPHLDASPP